MKPDGEWLRRSGRETCCGRARCLLAAGCASTEAAQSRRSSAVALSGVVPTSQSPVSPVASSTSSLPATIESNNAAAAREAAALVQLAQVPPGAQQLAAAPGVGADADVGVSVPWLLDHTQYWQVPMDFDTALAWEKAHPPAGTTFAWGGSGSGPSDHEVFLDYSPTTISPAWSDARLEIEVRSSTPTVSYLRVEGMAGAIDPTPYRDDTTDPRLRVTVTGGCPGVDKGGSTDANVGADLASRMVPVASATGGLLCDYSGERSYELIKATPLTAELAAKVAHQLALVPLDSRRRRDDKLPRRRRCRGCARPVVRRSTRHRRMGQHRRLSVDP